MQKPKQLPQSFCFAPFTHTFISPQGERRMCCASREPAQNFRQYIDTANGSGQFNALSLEQHWNSDHMQSVRRRMMAGQSLPECEVCNDKLLNTDVYRTYFTHMFADLYDDIWKHTDQNGRTTMPVVSWDYRYSNVCNFKCRMCGDMLSSAWESEAVNNHMVNLSNPKNSWLKQENRQLIRQFVSDTVVPEFEAAVESKAVREIYWAGGEPLLYAQHWSSMNRIVELEYADRVKVRYNTNLSQIDHKDQNLYAILEHYNHWEICASLDGTGAVGEYIRTGLNYGRWINNFALGVAAQKHSRQMRIDFTLTLPGLFELENVIRLANQYNVELLSKVVFSFGPDILLSPLALPRDILDEWIEQLQLRIKPLISPRTQSAWDMLQQLKLRPTFEQQWGEESAAIGRRQGKAHLLKLESIRQNPLCIDNILEGYRPAQFWWKNI